MANLINLKNRSKIKMSVILTFCKPNSDGESQEGFELTIPFSSKEKSAEDLLNKKLFKRIVKKCKFYKRNVGDLMKISISGDWKAFEQVTGKDGLPSLGHSCKWFFGKERPLDSWEKSLVLIYGFGAHSHHGSGINKAQLVRKDFPDGQSLLGLKKVGDLLFDTSHMKENPSDLCAVLMIELGIESVVLTPKSNIDFIMHDLETLPDEAWMGGLGKKNLHSTLKEKLLTQDKFFSKNPHLVKPDNQEWVNFCDDCVILIVLDAYLFNKPILLMHPDAYASAYKDAKVSSTDGSIPVFIDSIPVIH